MTDTRAEALGASRSRAGPAHPYRSPPVGWRGADYGNQRKYDADFGAALLRLEDNYRSYQPILDAASALVARSSRARDAIKLRGLKVKTAQRPAVATFEDQDAEAASRIGW